MHNIPDFNKAMIIKFAHLKIHHAQILFTSVYHHMLMHLILLLLLFFLGLFQFPTNMSFSFYFLRSSAQVKNKLKRGSNYLSPDHISYPFWNCPINLIIIKNWSKLSLVFIVGGSWLVYRIACFSFLKCVGYCSIMGCWLLCLQVCTIYSLI